MTCDQIEARLPDYMEGDLTGDERGAFERHVEGCADCRNILEELKSIVAHAAALGPIEPSRDLWSGIESRIGTQVVPLGSRRSIPFVRGLAAAVVLVAATAGITWQLAKRAIPASTPIVASAEPDKPSPNGTGPVIVTTPPQVASTAGGAGEAAGSAGSPELTTVQAPASQQRVGRQMVQAVRNDVRRESAAAVYDQEITRLHAVIERRRGELDPKTVAAIERSLAVIDTAIAQARSALAADPASRFLHGRLNDVLDKKVELLRTTAMLPARS
ncbi:MAG: zf-HC2 domain-containing protein [Gemmatimonadaceae bacterium]